MIVALIAIAQLSELTGLHELCYVPEPAYSTSQVSSYDRASKVAGNEAWFANGDYGQYLRTEGEGEDKEWIMADLKGPGALVRFWSANPTGTVRFRFDGEEKPRLETSLCDLLSGEVPAFGPRDSYVAARGWNLYSPIPYQKGLKISVAGDPEGARRLYYQIGYRTYSQGVSLSAGLPSSPALVVSPRRRFRLTGMRAVPSPVREKGSWVQTLYTAKGTGAITEIRLKPTRIGGIPPWGQKGDQGLGWMRHILLEAEFDGVTTVRVPIPDFFGCAPSIAAYKTVPMEVTAEGAMICRFKMPYRSGAKLRLIGLNGKQFRGSFSIQSANEPWSSRSMHFHAGWSTDRQGSAPFRDLQVLKVKGQGVYVGTGLHVSNPAGEWWGEGDEKVFVDGEKFPSTFGTGTEDYFGYAWCCPEVFAHPYHAQPRADGPANGGQVSNVRWHVLDAIPFTKSLDFRLEAWHWNQTAKTTWATTAYWYARPGGTLPGPIQAGILEPISAKPGEPLKGVVEGESLQVESKTGGTVEIQEGFWNLSGGKQLWWRDGKPGDQLILIGPEATARLYDPLVNFCFAEDYGSASFEVSGQALKTVDFYNSKLVWCLVELGGFHHPGGPIRIKITLGPSNPKAKPARNMVGIDWIEFN